MPSCTALHGVVTENGHKAASILPAANFFFFFFTIIFLFFSIGI